MIFLVIFYYHVNNLKVRKLFSDQRNRNCFYPILASATRNINNRYFDFLFELLSLRMSLLLICCYCKVSRVETCKKKLTSVILCRCSY